jgi:hypothetical protein
MAPVFKQPPLLLTSPSGGIDQRTVIGSQPRERWQVVGADQDVDAVNLVQGKPVDGLKPTSGGDSFLARAAQALGGKGYPPRLGERELFHILQLARPRQNTLAFNAGAGGAHGEKGSVGRSRPSCLLNLDQRAGEILRVEEQDRLAMGADFRGPVAEDARALGLESVAGGDDVRDLVA